MDISFKLDPEILIGADTLSMAGTICSRYGNRIMIAADHDLDSKIVNRLKEILEDSGVDAIVFDGIQEESSVEMTDNIVELCCAGHCAAIVGFGGVKAQIIARMAAIIAPTRSSSFELLDNRKITNKFLPLISIPTTGMDPFLFSEYFLVTDPRDRLIKSVPSPHKLLTSVILDSNLFKFLSGSNSAAYLFEGFLMASEAYCSNKANFFSDILLERALNLYARLIKNGSRGINADIFAQTTFLTSLGSSVSSPGAGAALALAISARYPTVRNVCAAALLPVITQRLVSARPEKMARVASFLGSAGKPTSVAEAANSAVDNIRRSMETLNVQTSLKNFNISLDKLIAAVETARKLEFIENSPWTVSEEDVFNILKQII
jgi:alcohol dehydrogenase